MAELTANQRKDMILLSKFDDNLSKCLKEIVRDTEVKAKSSNDEEHKRYRLHEQNYLSTLLTILKQTTANLKNQEVLGALLRCLLRLPASEWIWHALKELLQNFRLTFLQCLMREESTFALLYGMPFDGCSCTEKTKPRKLFKDLVNYAESLDFWLRDVVRELCIIRSKEPEGNVPLLRRTMELLPSYEWGAGLKSNAFGFCIFKNNKREYNLIFRTKTIQTSILKPLHSHITARERIAKSRQCFWDRLRELDVFAWSLDKKSRMMLLDCVRSPSCPLQILTLYHTGMEEDMAKAVYFNKSIEILKLTHSRPSRDSKLNALLLKSLSEGNCTIKYVDSPNPKIHSAMAVKHWCKLNRAGRAKLRQTNTITQEGFVEVLQPQKDELSTIYGLLREDPMIWAGISVA